MKVNVCVCVCVCVFSHPIYLWMEGSFSLSAVMALFYSPSATTHCHILLSTLRWVKCLGLFTRTVLTQLVAPNRWHRKASLLHTPRMSQDSNTHAMFFGGEAQPVLSIEALLNIKVDLL